MSQLPLPHSDLPHSDLPHSDLPHHDPALATTQTRFGAATLALASISGLFALWMLVETLQAVANDQFLAELGYVIVVLLGLPSVLATVLATVGLRRRGRATSWWPLGIALALALAPCLLWLLWGIS